MVVGIGLRRIRFQIWCYLLLCITCVTLGLTENLWYGRYILYNVVIYMPDSAGLGFGFVEDRARSTLCALCNGSKRLMGLSQSNGLCLRSTLMYAVRCFNARIRCGLSVAESMFMWCYNPQWQVPWHEKPVKLGMFDQSVKFRKSEFDSIDEKGKALHMLRRTPSTSIIVVNRGRHHFVQGLFKGI